MTAIPGCCARAANGRPPITAPAISVTNSRRLMCSSQLEGCSLPHRCSKRRVVHHSKFSRPMSQLGLVSRASPVYAAMRNYTRDEGGPFLRQDKSRRGEREFDLKPFVAVQRVQLPPGKGEPASRKRALQGWWQHHS